MAASHQSVFAEHTSIPGTVFKPSTSSVVFAVDIETVTGGQRSAGTTVDTLLGNFLPDRVFKDLLQLFNNPLCLDL